MVSGSKCKFLVSPIGAVLGICNAAGLRTEKMNQCFNKHGYRALIGDSKQSYLF